MLKVICSTLVIIILAAGRSFTPANHTYIGVHKVIANYKKGASSFTASAKKLQTALKLFTEKDSNTLHQAITSLKTCRQEYKAIEFFVEYFLDNRIRIFNLPPVFEVEEPFMEYQAPIGLQVIENLLMENRDSCKKEMLDNMEIILTTAEGLPLYLQDKNISDEQVLESLRLELIRISTLGITGYDAPLLKTGIQESYKAMESVLLNIEPYTNNIHNPISDSVTFYLKKSNHLLNNNNDFDSFDRMRFFTTAMLPAQTYMGKLITLLQLETNSKGYLNYKPDHLFSKEILPSQNFNKSENPFTAEMVLLGEKLFFAKDLSGNQSRSCATCHQPEKYFTDGLSKSTAFDGHNTVRRNAPSILYAAQQHGFFLDGRAASLEEQVLAVLSNPTEMNANLTEVSLKLKSKRSFKKLFRKAYPETEQQELFSIQNVARALVAYQLSLPVMTSPFDQFMNGDTTALSYKQIAGFNLFMGKAVCGTCHFAPLFNGLLPPAYDIMELESLGLTKNTNFENPVADTDSGRYHFFPIEFYTGVFKTPTVRNVAMTAPYMHNGAFANLTEVIEFYNKGGGKGLGLDIPHQTLPGKALNLTEKESAELLVFLESLTDKALKRPRK